jgi:hypothetical protein
VESLRLSERWQEALPICRDLVRRSPQNPDDLGIEGALAARTGDREGALRISDELGRMNGPYLFGAHTYRRACIAAVLGDRPEAIDLLRKSLAEGKRFGLELHRDIDLERLWDYEPFKALLKPRG